MGGLSLVHSRCLMKWIEMRPQQEEEQMMKCEICREPYKVELRYRFSCRAEKVSERSVWGGTDSSSTYLPI